MPINRRRILIRDTRLQASLERGYTRRLISLLRRFANEAAKQLTPQGEVPEPVYEAFERALSKLLLQSNTKVSQSFGKLQETDLKSSGFTYDRKQNDLFQEFINSWLTEHAAERATTLTESQKISVRSIITSLQKEELIGQEALAKALRKEIRGLSPFQSARIARTETHTAAMISKQTIAETSGLIGLRKEWVAAEDSRTRESHNEVDGRKIPLDTAFSVGDDSLMFPGDPNGSAKETINCRCTLAYE